MVKPIDGHKIIGSNNMVLSLDLIASVIFFVMMGIGLWKEDTNLMIFFGFVYLGFLLG